MLLTIHFSAAMKPLVFGNLFTLLRFSIGSGAAREEDAREGKAHLAQRSTIIAFPIVSV